MDAGDRWTLNNVAGNPIRGWTFFGDPDESQLRTVRTTYDALQRPKHLWVQQGDEAEFLAEQTVYGEDKPDPEATNHLGKVWQVYDQAGIVTSEAYDFKGNLRHSTRQLVQEYKQAVNWADSPRLEDAIIYRSETSYDALNRPTQLVTPHCEGMSPNVIQPGYNEANLLETVDVWVRRGGDLPPGPLAPGTATFRAVANINYNAKGQRELIEYGNGVTTAYTYDPETFRLTHLYTRRDATFTEDCGSEPPPPRFAAPAEPPANQPCGLQNLQYTYDPAGNITTIHDGAQPTIFFRNQRVDPHAAYTYDPLYRLTAATGREHLGQLPDGRLAPPTPTSHDDVPRMNRLHPEDGQALGRYRQQYVYDEVGNILEMIHRGTDPDHPGWRRCYQYALDSNRLLSTGYQSDPLVNCDTPYAADPVYPQVYTYDRHGNMTQMPHLPLMQWDFKDQLQASSKQVRTNGTPETTYYVYDASGQRVRKVTERQNGTPMKERIYLGGFELYREYNGNGNTLTKERETLHVMDGQQRIALVETQTFGESDVTGNGPVANPLIRYQLNNHLDSACVELDEHGNLISYEEFYPYGSTAYQAGRSVVEVSLKRYRYTGKERDEESSFYYHEARYYMSWLARWINPDPDTNPLYELLFRMQLAKREQEKRLEDEKEDSLRLKLLANPYEYALCNPICLTDATGRDPTPEEIQAVATQIQDAANELLRILQSNSVQHAMTRGTFEAAIAESQGAELTKPSSQTAQHLQNLRNSTTAIAQRREALVQAMNTLRRMGPNAVRAHEALRQALQPLLQRSGEFLRLSAQTQEIIAEIRFTSNTTRLTGAPLNTGRDTAHLVSTQLQNMRVSLLPNGISQAPWVQRTLYEIRQLPTTLSGVREQVRLIATTVTSSLSACIAAGRAAASSAGSALVNFFGRALPILEEIGGSLSSPVIFVIVDPETGRPIGIPESIRSSSRSPEMI
jgi:RHS repeat-associated protein